MITRMLRALARRAGEGDVEALEELAGLQAILHEQLGAGIAGYRAQGHSWADVALTLGSSRQAAQQRFGNASTDPAHGPRCTCALPHCPRTWEQAISSLVVQGWTEDSAMAHVRGLCDRELCNAPHETEGEL